MSAVKRTNRPIFTKTIQILVILLLVITLIGVLLGQFLIRNYRQNTYRMVENAVRQYIAMRSADLGKINQEIRYVAANDENIKNLSKKNLEETPEEIELHHSIYVVNTAARLTNMVNVYGTSYYFWIYDSKSGDYIDWGQNDYLLRMQFRQIIQQQIEDDAIMLSESGRWFVLDKEYLCTVYQYRGVYIGSWISATDYCSDLAEQQFSELYYVDMLDQDGQTIQSASSRYNRSIEDRHGISYDVFEATDNQTDFRLVFKIGYRWYEDENVIQLVIAAFSLLILFGVFCFAIYVRNKILQPIIDFYGQIVDTDGRKPFNISGQVVELDKAAAMLNNLSGEVRNLQLEKYRQQVQFQEAQLGFAQQQIRPHFFINCLNVIYSMAQVNQKEEIQELCLHISGYIRLLFGNSTNYILLEQELKMLEQYLCIMKKIYGQEFHYELDCKSPIEGIQIPPLLIQTFVENSIKFGDREEGLSIYVSILRTVKEEKERLQIVIRDTGVGFRQNVMDELNAGTYKSIRNGYQIGIGNVRQRLSLLYQDGYNLCFSNTESGAEVRIEIPCSCKENGVDSQ